MKAAAVTLDAWLGSGNPPVPIAQAASRAMVCGSCPLNQPARPRSMGDLAKRGLADVILRTLSWKERLRLTLPNENKLGLCDACGCVLRLKVWVPLEHIIKTMQPQDTAKLHPECWIRKEQTP